MMESSESQNTSANCKQQIVTEHVLCNLNLRLTNLIGRTKYCLTQCNGQRIYGPPPNWNGSRPPRGCEIFIGRLPRDAFEDELVPIFSNFGKIYELRLMMEFSGYTRGFCFVMYANRHSANRAVRCLHCLEIRPDVKISAYRSLDNSRLFVGGIPLEKTADEISLAFKSTLEGITRIIVYPNPYHPNKNRGYVFVDFESHRHAIEARRIMWPSRLVFWGAQLHAEWAVPMPVDNNVRKLFITNLNCVTTKETLTHIIFKKTKCCNSIVNVYRQRNFAIVQFTSRQYAQMALEVLDGLTVDGYVIVTKWMKDKNDKS